MNTQLDPFQTALLTELRAVVESAPAPRRHRRGPVLVAAAAAVTVGAVAAPGLVGGQPAYAVVPGANGAVDVRVNRLEDAAGLERALVAAGVRADITYLPEGQLCAEGRYVDAVAPDQEAHATFSMGAGGYRVQLDPGVIGNDQTLVIAASHLEPGGVSGQMGIAAGPVAPCRPMSVSLPDCTDCHPVTDARAAMPEGRYVPPGE